MFTKEEAKIYYHSHKERILELRKKPSNRYRQAISYAKKRKKFFDLTLDEYTLLISNPCYYCNISISNERFTGLDRIDSLKGYTLDNVVPCCGPCNKVKSNILTKDEMKFVMTKLKEYRNAR